VPDQSAGPEYRRAPVDLPAEETGQYRGAALALGTAAISSAVETGDAVRETWAANGMLLFHVLFAGIHRWAALFAGDAG
jgi:hypothetical protein